MTKKLFGGASLLIFVMTLLVITNSAYSHDNREDWYQIKQLITCVLVVKLFTLRQNGMWINGTKIIHQTYGVGKKCVGMFIIGDEDRWEEECEWMEVPYHQSHWITYRLYEDYKTIKRRATPNRCRSLR